MDWLGGNINVSKASHNAQLSHSYTGKDCLNNRDGKTHSQKCVNGCGQYGGEPKAHTGMGDFVCDDCCYVDTATQLNAAKEQAKKEIEQSAGKNPSEEMQNIIEQAKQNIDNADTLEKVKAEKQNR